MFKLDRRLLSWLTLLQNAAVLALVAFLAALATASLQSQPVVQSYYADFALGNLHQGGWPSQAQEPVREGTVAGTADARFYGR
jgi:hypothetical protein